MIGLPEEGRNAAALGPPTLSCRGRRIGRAPHAPITPAQALDRGAAMMKADKIATGHNADDIAETVLLNFLRADLARWAGVPCCALVSCSPRKGWSGCQPGFWATPPSQEPSSCV